MEEKKEFLSVIKLTEMSEDIEKSLKSAEKVIMSQSDLIDVIMKSDKKDVFKDFTSQLAESNGEYKKQLSVLKEKKESIDSLLEEVKNDDSKKAIIENLFKILGIL